MVVTLSAVRAPVRDDIPAARPAWRRALSWRLACALASGLLLVLAFPPYDVVVLAPVGPALLVLACRGVPVRRGALLGLLAGLAFYLPLLHWAGVVVGPGAWIALAVLQSLFTGLLGAALAVVTRRPGWALWSAVLWVATEAFRSRAPFGGFPWGRLAFSQADSPLLPLASLGGAPTVSLAVALLGGALAALVVARGRELVLVAVPALALVVAGLLAPVPTGGPTTTVAVVQGNVPRLGFEFNAQRSAVLRYHVAATHQLAQDVRAGRVVRPDLVIWPENASDLDPFSDPEAAALIDGAVKDVAVPVLVGALVDGPGRFLSNTGVVWDPVTGPGARYVKRHPVPFGEYIPLRGLARRITTKVDLVPRDFAHGTRVGVLDVGPARIGDVICFEVAYDDLVRDIVVGGGRLIVVQTNNATFGRSGETVQQLAMGRLRAVEHGRAVLVAATSGVSAVIAPDGRVIDRAEVFTRDVLVQRVPLRDDHTLATRVGAWPELALSLLGLCALAFAVRASAVTSRRAA